MKILGIVLARAGSKGLPDKCVRPLLGRPVIDYTFDHALASKSLSAVTLTTDSNPAKNIARQRNIEVIDRPAELADDRATVDAAARHAVQTWESRHGVQVDAVVLLYGNIPVRPDNLIDRAIDHLKCTNADSVRSVAPVTKQHPDWVHRLSRDRMTQFRRNTIYRRQDLEPLYYHDGAVAAVTRKALFSALQTPDDHQAFLGRDRRAIICKPEDAVDIDGPVDFALAEAILKLRSTDSSHAPAATLSTTPDCRVRIAGKPIGADWPVFVIAEAGVNHNGDLATALKMADVAAEAGADAIKFQVFRAEELASHQAQTVRYQRDATSQQTQKGMLRALELSDEQLLRIKKHCDLRRIVFFATPFGIADVARLVGLGVPAIKIASPDLVNRELLQCVTGTGLPLIVSTGAATEPEISDAVYYLREAGAHGRLVLLHCISAYPASMTDLNLNAIRTIGQAFGVPAGLSDHTLSTLTGGLAVAAGACIVEKHFTLDKTMSGPDHAMSLMPAELSYYVQCVRQAEQGRGDGRLGMSPSQREVREAARRSVVASTLITKGTRITRSMLSLKRPGTGIPPQQMEHIIGKAATVDIPGDSLLSWDMMR